ncbi:hypothetical protein PoB_003693500 [Plakobranchus ocellatus]|uniref:Uncharacterized protein n=1 Tax=Plakobranchus ocellatus TaxID=259542 RepID=A0AAV4ASY7_9GAST|nr:hypothetical protein PoB_003693500 [Plakobranchus ocellatus]
MASRSESPSQLESTTRTTITTTTTTAAASAAHWCLTQELTTSLLASLWASDRCLLSGAVDSSVATARRAEGRAKYIIFQMTEI